MYKLIALLERPSEKSFGMVAIVVRTSNEPLPFVSGLSEASRWRTFASQKEAEKLLHNQCGVVESCGITFSQRPVELLAGWLGTAFEENCHKENVPVPVIPDTAIIAPLAPHDPEFLGRFWIGPPPEVYIHLDDWMKAVAPLAFKRRSREIARLMNWCLPLREESQAAVWYTTEDDEKRKRWLRFNLQTNPKKGMTAKKLRRKFEGIVDKMLATPDLD